MTAWVVRVLFKPMNAPETMTATMSVVLDEGNKAMTNRSAASSERLT